MYDYIVVGAGIGGLTVASCLARGHKKVLLLEKHTSPGGYATTFLRKGESGNVYTFETSLHSLGGADRGNLGRIFEQCGVKNKITLLEIDPPWIYVKDKKETIIPGSIDDYAKDLISRYPTEKKGIKHYVEFLKNENQILVKNRELQSLRYADVSVYDFFKKECNFSDEIIEELTITWGYYGLPAKQLNAFYFLIATASYSAANSYYIKGGSQTLSNAYVEVIKENGGEVLLGSEVTEFVFDKNRVVAVKTQNNEYRAHQFIMSGSPVHLVDDLIKTENEAIRKLKERISQYEIGPSLLQLYIGLKGNPSRFGIKHCSYYIASTSHEKYFEQVKAGENPYDSFVLCNYNKKDQSLNPIDSGFICVTHVDFIHHWPEMGTPAYKEKKQVVMEKTINALEKMFPGVKEAVDCCEVGTPRTMEAYTNNPQGSVYGFAQTTSQGGANYNRMETPIENLYFASSWAFMGGGYEGAASAGFALARHLLSDTKGIYFDEKKIKNASRWIFGAILPWIVYSIVGQWVSPLVNLILFALLLVGGYVLRPFKKRVPFDLLSGVGFIFLAALTWAEPSILEHYFASVAPILCGLLFLVGIHKYPMTAYYSRYETPPMANHPVFLRVNRLLSGLWASVFIVVGVLNFLIAPPWTSLSSLLYLFGFVLMVLIRRGKLL